MKGVPQAPPHYEDLPCRVCAKETPHRVLRYADGCVGTCTICKTSQVCPCTPEEVKGAHEWQACPWHRP